MPNIIIIIIIIIIKCKKYFFQIKFFLMNHFLFDKCCKNTSKYSKNKCLNYILYNFNTGWEYTINIIIVYIIIIYDNIPYK